MKAVAQWLDDARQDFTLCVSLSGVGAADPAAISGVFTIVMVIAALATYIPARRAATADPLLTLRVE